MGKKIISVRSEIYKEQPPGKYCRAYVVDAILQAGGINVSENPREMLSTLGKLSGAMMPKTLEKLLTENGLSAKIKYGFRSSTDELREKIKEEIDGGNPVALAVSRNYTKDHPKAHWISVWGYDSKGVFIYDPRENASNTQ